jgi:hypothetical protein
MDEDKNVICAVRSLLSARFLLSALILVLAASTLRPGIQALNKYYMKKPIEIRRPLKEFDASRLPSFQNGWTTSAVLPHELFEDIGTDEGVFILLDKELQQADLLITYYSNPKDKVPHTPDVCYRQAGAIVRKMRNIELDIPELLPKYPKIKARLVVLQLPACNKIVIFLFCAEGKLRYSREQVRWIIGKPGNRYTYFSKIEAASNYPIGGDEDEAIETCKILLREALPVLLTEYFPDKKQLKAR